MIIFLIASLSFFRDKFLFIALVHMIVEEEINSISLKHQNTINCFPIYAAPRYLLLYLYCNDNSFPLLQSMMFQTFIHMSILYGFSRAETIIFWPKGEV